MRQVRAAVLREPGAPLSVEEVGLDDPHAGEVLVRVEAAGVCRRVAAGRADTVNACGGDVRPGPVSAVAGEAGTHRGVA